MISRRAFLAGLPALAVGSKARGEMTRAPALFVQHGPYFATERERSKRDELVAWSTTMPAVRGIVAMTPHFGGRALTYGPAGRARLLYNVPDDIKAQLAPDLAYASPADDALARRVGELLHASPQRTTKEGLEHTLWMPLMYLFPRADAPVLQLSFPLWPGADLFALGRTLAPLRDEGIAIVGSGSISHNLAAFGAGNGPPAWMTEFEAWTKERVLARDVDALCDFRNKAPAQSLNHPDGGEHFKVLLLALGAAHDRVELPIAGSLRGIQLA